MLGAVISPMWSRVPALDDRINAMLAGIGGVNFDVVGRGGTSCDQEKGLNLAEPRRQGLLLGLWSTCSRRHHGDQERQARPPRDRRRLRLLLRRAGGDH